MERYRFDDTGALRNGGTMARKFWLRRAGVIVTVVTGAVASTSGLAFAATTGTAKVSGTTVTFTAGTGVTNAVVVTGSGKTIVIDDRVALKPGAGCKRVSGDKTRVKCTATKNIKLIRVSLGNGNDTFVNKTATAKPIASTVTGGPGDDTLTGGANKDVLGGDTGNDKLYGRSGVDTLSGHSGNDLLSGGDGNDTLIGAAGNDILTDDYGTDTLDGGDGNDSLSGGRDADKLHGANGDDRLNGGAGKDVISGESGDDTLIGGTDSDTLDGGDGTDVADYGYLTAAYELRIELGYYSDSGYARVSGSSTGGQTEYELIFKTENIIGGSGNDFIWGDAAANVIRTGSGNDTVYGGAGNDTVVAGVGQDYLSGDEGDDNLWAEPAGSDTGYREIVIGGPNDTETPGDSCYLPQNAQHVMAECETVATAPPA